jgi:hypothetical protein
MTTKKIFIIILVLFLLTSGALVVYNLFLKNTNNAPAKREVSFPQGELNLKINQLSKEKALAPAIGEDNKTVKYYYQNGPVFSSSFDGSAQETISDNKLPGLLEINWSPDRKKVIGIFQGAPEKKYYYDFETKKSTLLNESIESLAWAPSSEKIAYHYITADNKYDNINIADPDGNSWHAIFQTRLTNLIVKWPSADKIYIYDKPSGLTQGSLYTIDPESGSFATILADIYGLDVSWSPDGQKMLYTATDAKGKNLKLYIAAADGSQQKEMPFQTLIKKCVWEADSQTVFCAVPQQFSQYAVWPDDYELNRVAVTDDMYIINTATLQKTKIAGSSTAQSFDAQNLILAPNNDYLFFVNTKDGMIYSLKLEF